MAKCEFAITLTISPKELISSAAQSFEAAGGHLEGDERSGKFVLPTPLGIVSGEFSFTQDGISVRIIEKPLLVSCNRIREELSKRI